VIEGRREEEVIEIEELCDNIGFFPKQGEFHSETKQNQETGVTGEQREGRADFYAADGLLLPGVFHGADVGANADAGEGD
jgi:hypothetical protein